MKKNYTGDIDIWIECGRILGSVIIVIGIVVANAIGSVIMSLNIVDRVIIIITSMNNCWI